MVDGAKVGDVLAGRYELREQLRTSQLGRDFSAWDRAARENVAVMTFDQPLDVQAVPRHAEITRRATGVHPALVLPRHVTADGAPQFAVCQALRGADLDALRVRGGALLWPRAAEIVAATAEALSAAHRATGRAHRVLHPTSIWITDAAVVRILDFGTAELAKPVPQARPGGVFVEYRAPEQIEGDPGNASADVFTLAVLLLEAATGIHPFSAPSAYKAAHKVVHKSASALDACSGGAALPQQAHALLQRALARRPEDRLADLEEFLRYLTIVRQAAGSTPRMAKPSPPAQPVNDAAHETTSGDARDATTMIRVPASRITHPPEAGMEKAEAPTELDPPADRGSVPPLLGGSSGPNPVFRQSRPGDIVKAMGKPEPLPALPEDTNATTVFTPPQAAERTEVLSRPQEPLVERTECLPRASQRSPVEPTLVLAESKSAAPGGRTPPGVDATVCDRRPELQGTLLLPQAEGRILWSPPSRPEAKAPETTAQSPEAAMTPEHPPSTLLLLLNVVLAVLILCGILALLS